MLERRGVLEPYRGEEDACHGSHGCPAVHQLCLLEPGKQQGHVQCLCCNRVAEQRSACSQGAEVVRDAVRSPLEDLRVGSQRKGVEPAGHNRHVSRHGPSHVCLPGPTTGWAPQASQMGWAGHSTWVGPHRADSAPKVSGEGAIQVRGRSISREPDRPVGHVCCHHGDIPEHLPGQRGEPLVGAQLHSFLGINTVTGNM